MKNIAEDVGAERPLELLAVICSMSPAGAARRRCSRGCRGGRALSRVCSTASRQNFSSPMSPAISRHWRPSFSTSAWSPWRRRARSGRRSRRRRLPSRNAIATARPMPLSPPVMSALRPCNFPLPRCAGSSEEGRGVISCSRPGCVDCFCFGRCFFVVGMMIFFFEISRSERVGVCSIFGLRGRFGVLLALLLTAGSAFALRPTESRYTCVMHPQIVLEHRRRNARSAA